MKRNLRMIVAACAVFTLVSCGGNTGSAPGEVTQKDAGCIIDYYNKAIDVFAKAKKPTEYEDAIKYMKNKGQRGVLIWNNFTIYSDSSKMVNPGTCFTSGARDTLRMAFRGYYGANKQFEENIEAFKKYRSAEDYKDDNWAKGMELASENEELLEYIQGYRALIHSIIGPLADEAELIGLADNPRREYIVMSKGIFEQMELIYDVATEDKVDHDAIATAYGKLEQMIAAGRGFATPDIESGERKKEQYNSFLDDVEEFMGVVRKGTRDKRYTSSTQRDLQRKYESSIRAYNRFID